MSQNNELPPLPEPENEESTDGCTFCCPEGYTADQMRDYALAARAALAAQAAQSEPATMTPLEFEDGRKGWYIHTPDFYADVEPDEKTGAWSVFFRDKMGKEGFSEQPAPVRQPLSDEDIDALWDQQLTMPQKVQRRVIARAIEAKINEKGGE